MRLLEAERNGFTEDTRKQVLHERRVYIAVIFLTIAFGLAFKA